MNSFSTFRKTCAIKVQINEKVMSYIFNLISSFSIHTVNVLMLWYNTDVHLLGLDVPMDLAVTASTDNTITLVWGVVQGPIDHYKVTFTSSSGVTTEVKQRRTLNG